jgi:hypothetical protein
MQKIFLVLLNKVVVCLYLFAVDCSRIPPRAATAIVFSVISSVRFRYVFPR